MSRLIGTTARGLRAPIIRQGDDLISIVGDLVDNVVRQEGVELRPRDILAVTESVVARCQGNYATVEQIARDVQDKYPQGELGLILPILSRNRFAVVLRGIAMGVKKMWIQLSYPGDEVGNNLISLDDLDEAGIDPYRDVLSEERYHELFGNPRHEFTGVDYVAYFRQVAEEAGAEVEIFFANDPREILKKTPYVLSADIHSRKRSKRLLKQAGAKTVYGLDDLLSAPVCGSGYNPDYGLLGSNKADEDTVKLFPRDCKAFVEALQERVLSLTGVKIEVMIYGDGAFKDPRGGIWEFADPVLSPGFTDGLIGLPNELKLKYLADNDFSGLSGEELRSAIVSAIKAKEADLKGKMVTEGTTPRQLTDLIGSLCDLVSGSGDKGTPVILIQGYFDNYSHQD